VFSHGALALMKTTSFCLSRSPQRNIEWQRNERQRNGIHSTAVHSLAFNFGVPRHFESSIPPEKAVSPLRPAIALQNPRPRVLAVNRDRMNWCVRLPVDTFSPRITVRP